MSEISIKQKNINKKADWELDFYSRPIIEPDGKKRWELLITTTEDFSKASPFRWEKKCPAGQVNSLWLAEALREALLEAEKQGWEAPLRIRCWRTSMRTMIKKAASNLELEVIASRRTYSLVEWISQREKEIYPNEKGYIAGPLATSPSSSPILNDPIPLPEAVRGDAWNFTSLPLGVLKEANEWPIEFKSLLPIKETIEEKIQVPGLRLFSKNRSLALAGWLGGLEPVKLVVKDNQLLLEAGQEDRWLVTDMNNDIADLARETIKTSKDKGDGMQFIAVQSTPEEKSFAGFWMMRDIDN
tara:strand:- start:181 stop:1080 length:900 start_codon:yes stop_codon:yes gene_type:complete